MPAKNYLLLSLAILLCACGSGSALYSSVANAPSSSPPAPPAPQAAPPSEGYLRGTRALKKFLLDGEYLPLRDFEISYVRNKAAENLLPDAILNAFISTRDTKADQAWDMGWTGCDVKVGHLDDFIGTGAHGDFAVSVTFQVAPEIDHSAQQLSFGCDLAPGTQSRQILAAYNHFNDNGYHIVNNSFGGSRYNHGFCGGPERLLSEAIWNNAINDTIRDPVFRNFAGIINETTSYDENMLFVFAAGNDAEFCFGGVGACNLGAASLLKLRETEPEAGARVLFVSSISDASRDTANQTILAAYAHPAGALKNDFIVAHDDVFNAVDAIGTSYAAPRVVGAAALVRQKFPSLNGAGLKQVLLQSADDLGAQGVDEVFGHGRLNVINALSPIGGLTQ